MQPPPHRSNLLACQDAAAYMHASGEGIEPPYSAVVDIVCDIQVVMTNAY